MKRQRIIISFSLLILLFGLFSACSAEPTDSLFPSQSPNDNAPQNEVKDYEAAIRDLENRIIELQQNQYISDAEYEKELSELLTRLEALRAESQDKTPSESDPSTPPSEENENTPTAKALFLYKVADGEAIITGYTGSDSNVIIPSAIDGYSVCAIGEGALTSEQIHHVTLSNGIKRIEWFAFRDCPNLSSVTIPDSVTSIGYEAFGTRGKSFTIYCHSGSFAQSYAKSYGITYAIH